jgi:hypothetical protein
MKLFLEVVGWIGSIAILIAYGLNSYQKLRSDSLWFYFLNLAGGICLVAYTIYKEAFANTFINFVWVLIAGIGIARMVMRKINLIKK